MNLNNSLRNSSLASPSSDSFEYIAGVYYEEIEMDVANNGLFDLSVGGEFAKSFGLPDIAAFQTRLNLHPNLDFQHHKAQHTLCLMKHQAAYLHFLRELGT